MPKSQLEISIEKATNENNVVEDWGLYMEIVDQINQTNSEKEAIRIFMKRLNDRDPHVINHTLTLLNACVSNCHRNFKLEVCSRVFIDELTNFVLRRKHPRLSDKLATMIEGWYQEKEFKNDPAFNLIPTLYIELKKNGVEFLPNNTTGSQNMKSSSTSSSKSYSDAKKEEEDLAKAIQLSLKEANATQSTRSKGQAQNSLYGSLLSNVISSSNGSSASNNYQSQRKRKVKALYDFEAVEENEISFKAGNFLFVTDESDQNWWKGIDTDGNEGLFPSNFVTSDLDTEIESFDTGSNNSSNTKKVTFNDDVNVKEVQRESEIRLTREKVYIDEKKIDDCIELLQNADPTGEIQPDTQALLELEDQCYMMGPLIDKQLQQIDYKHVVLEDLNLKMLEAFQIYNNLMKESISKSTIGFINPNVAQQPIGLNPGVNPGASLRGANAIPYVAAPPLSSIDQSSLLLANQLNSMALSNNAFQGQQNTGIPSNHQAPQFASNFQNYNNEPQSFNPSANINPQMYAPMNNNNIPTSNFSAGNFQPQVNSENGILAGVSGVTNNQSAITNPNFYK